MQYPLIRLTQREVGNADLRFADNRDDLQSRQVLFCQSGQMVIQVNRRCFDRARCDQFEQHQVFVHRNFILGQSQFSQRARCRRKRHLIMTNEFDEMLVRCAKDAKLHEIALKLHPVCRPLFSRITGTLTFQQLGDLLEVDAIARQAKCFGFQESANLKTLSDRLRRQRTYNPVRTRCLGDDAALMQSAEHVADDSSADSIIVAELRLDNTKFTKNQTGGDGGFHFFVDDFPKTSILKRGVNFIGDTQTELADVASNWLRRRSGAADQVAASVETVNKLLLLQDSQRGLNRRPTRT